MSVIQKNRVIWTLLYAGSIGSSYAGAFSLYTEGSASEIGVFAAGSAAEVADASTGWYNPAGLPLLKKQQLIVSGVGVSASSKITGTSTFETEGFSPYVQSFSDLQGGKKALVPAFHYALPLGDRAAFGFSAVVPFGLSTEYSPKSPVRYSATYTSLMTGDVSPELGVQITDNFAFGAGLDFQWAKVKFNRILGNPTLMQFVGFPPDTLDSLSYNAGQSTGVGCHIGGLALFNNNHTRLGLNYQSQIEHEFHGYSRLTGPFASTLFDDPTAVVKDNGLFSSPITFPNIVTLSAYQDISERISLLGSIVYSGWNTFKVTTLHDVVVLSDMTVDFIEPQDYRNAWRFAIGGNYRINERWQLRAGGGYDQTPTVNKERDVRLPDANRYALSIGAHYQMFPSLGFDAGYAYLWAAENPKINKHEPLGDLGENIIKAEADVHAHLLGIQAVWTIDSIYTK